MAHPMRPMLNWLRLHITWGQVGWQYACATLISGFSGSGAVIAQTVSRAPDLPPAAALLAASGGPAERVMPLEVTVNGAKSGTWPLVERLGILYAPRDAFEEWRVQVRAGAAAIVFKGMEYLPLSAIPGFSAKVNFGNQSVDLTFSPQAFAATRLTTELSSKPVLSPVMPSLFVNYDLNYATTAPRGGAVAKDLGLLTEIGASNAWGVVTSSFAGRNLTHSTPGGISGWLRLETTFTRDLPDSNQTLRLGDTSTRPGMWARNVYFGGVKWGSNFALTPGFISQPLPALSGTSAAPSTVELYVNDVLRQVSSVPTGPFAIDNLPGMTGGGEARLVVRDILGRETVITQPFFTSAQLLAQGLNDWSVESGRLRLDLGKASGHYGQGFASGTWRRGLTDQFTVEGHAESTRQNQVLGLSTIAGLPGQTLGKAALAASRESSLGTGHLWLLGLERQVLRSGIYLQAQGASINFRQLGQDPTAFPTKLQLAGNATYTTEKMGTVGVGFASIDRFDNPRVTTVSGSYSTRLGERNSLSVTASRAIVGGGGYSIGMTLVVPMENNRTATAAATSRGGQRDIYASVTQNPGFDGNLGWRTLAGQLQSQPHAEAGLYYTGTYGRLSGDLSASSSQTAMRLGANGGLVLADGHVFATRHVDDSFAIAEVKGYGNVGMGLGSNMLTRTNAEGVALIPRLMPYANNPIRIDASELPLSAEIDSIEQTVVPAWRSGVKVVFPVRTGRGALIKIVFDDAAPAPAGAIVQIEGDPQEFYVARRGEAFVTGLQATNRLRLTWNSRQCQFSVVLPPESPDEIVRLGPLSCQGIAR